MISPPATLKSRYGWTLVAFALAAFTVAAFVGWQLYETAPRAWCALAEATSPENTNACLAVLLKLIDMKDHALIGLMSILGITVVSILAVALGLRISAAGPGATSINVGASDTTVQNEDVSLTVPTPPSESK
jgi:uncharacterized membrane protein required for colicin V production